MAICQDGSCDDRLHPGVIPEPILVQRLKNREVKRDWHEAVNTFLRSERFEGRDTLRVTKDPEIVPVDEPTYAKLSGSNFHNGVIEVRVLSRLLPDAPDFARGFIGLWVDIGTEGCFHDVKVTRAPDSLV